MKLPLICLLAVLPLVTLSAEEPAVPDALILPGSKLYDVTRPETWGGDVAPATPNDPSDDDSLAINAALAAAAAEIERIRPGIEADWEGDEHAVYQQLVVLPAGEFHLESPVVFPLTHAYPEDRWDRKERFLWLQGAGRDRTSLRLKPAAEIGELGRLGHAKPVVEAAAYDPGTHQGNDNYLLWVTDCTIRVPADQPHAIGLSFGTANMGGVRRVAIRADGEAGAVGLALVQRNNGPAMVEDLLVEGFDRGIEIVDPWGEGFALANLTLRNQNAGGVALSVADKQIGIENLTIEQDEADVTPILLHDDAHPNFKHGGAPHLTLVDARIRNSVPAEGPAVRIEKGHSYLRGIETEGYGEALVIDHGEERVFPGGTIAEYVSVHGKTGEEAPGVTRVAGDAPAISLHLPGRAAPRIPEEAHAALAEGDFRVLSQAEVDRGETATGSAWVLVDPTGAEDDTDLFQAALDSGARFVGVLNHEPVTVSRTLVVNGGGSGKVELIFGSMAEFENDGADVLFRIESGEAPRLLVEGFRIAARDRMNAEYLVFENGSDREVCFRDLMIDASHVYRNRESAVGSEVFFSNVCFVAYGRHAGRMLIFDRQHVRAWQFDVERLRSDTVEPLIVNRGGTLRVMSQKYGEHNGVFVRTEEGGRTELLSAFLNIARTSDHELPGPAPHVVISGADSELSMVGQERIRTRFDDDGRAIGPLPHRGEFAVWEKDGERVVIEGASLPTYLRHPGVDPLDDREWKGYAERNRYRVAGLLRVGAVSSNGPR